MHSCGVATVAKLGQEVTVMVVDSLVKHLIKVPAGLVVGPRNWLIRSRTLVKGRSWQSYRTA